MDVATRRKFLIASGVAGAGALAIGAGALGLAELLQTADRPRPTPPGRQANTLVLVTLYGGNDGLNTVVPYRDPAYRAARPDLAYQPDRVLPLDAALGLNPVLKGFKSLWDARRLAVILGVGYPRPDRSHFRSMDIWHTATPAAPTTTGWVGRWLDGTNAPVEAAVSFEPVLPPLLVGRHRIGACVSYTGLALPSWVDPALVTALGNPSPGDTPMRSRVAAGYADLLRMGQVVAGPDQPPTAGTDAPMSTATGTGGDNALGAQLALVARCVEAGVPTRVYSVSLGGFDTHADELAGQELLLGELDTALTAFTDRMSRSEAGRRVAVVVYSEFGRRVRANASDGTDHGTAGPMFVLGHHVTGGFYGEQPSLTDLHDGDLKASTDFRDVYATVLSSVLDADPARYIDGHRATLLPFLPGG